jgi:ABC-2 type transport system ATP-binding protein
MHMQPPRIEARGLGKSYGPVTALSDVTLQAGAGTVLGVLGHNGAGKTTLVDVLSTRTLPSTGSARVCGFDVVASGHQVRRRIGLTGQFVALDETLSGYDNLVLIARLLGAGRRPAAARARELLEAFGLADAARRKPATYSGGMRRRLDLAASLIGRPDVLFLDEPTTGLDPVAKAEVWMFIDRLAADGATVVLTTQDLAEADRLASDIVVLAGGKIVASGTPQQLKAGVGNRTATLVLADPRAVSCAVDALMALGLCPATAEQPALITVPLAAGGQLTSMLRELDLADVGVADLTVTETSLMDVYLSLHRSGWQASP